MSLLPKDHEEFRQTDYWNRFFERRGQKAFEWYGEYGQLCGILHKYVKNKDKILIVGCGNSTLSADLYDVGLRDITSIDISEVVIKQMRSLHHDQRPGLRFEQMDVTQMTQFESESFSCVIDKGTLDAMFTSDANDVVENVDKMFNEIQRVLRFGGRYICISLLQPHILNHIVEWFSDHKELPIRITRCKEAEENRAPEDRIFPVFVVVVTKFKKMANMPKVLEMSLSSSGNITRLQSGQELLSSIRGIQQFAAIRAGASKTKYFAKGAQQEDVSLDLKTPDSDNPRYSLYFVNRDKRGSLKFAVFIVPQGRETEWMFSTPEGRRQIAEQADCETMIVVHLGREHQFSLVKEIQDELSGFVMELAPSDLPASVQVPFLSLGGDNVGERKERYRGKSEYSGEFVVEDVEVNGEYFRRLIFLDNPNVTQSEAKLMQGKGKSKKGARKIIDQNYLACTHHSLMIAALGTFDLAKDIRILLVGLGGGALAAYIHNHFEKAYVDVVEIDPAIAKVASEHFGFAQSDRLKVFIADGLEYIRDYQGSKYDLVLFDIDSKDRSLGMRCPPAAFLEKAFLNVIRSNCLFEEGMFVLNLVCRDAALREKVLQDVSQTFSTIVSYKVPEEVNEILYCSDTWPSKSRSLGKKQVLSQTQAHNEFTKAVKIVLNFVNDKEFINLSESMKQISIVHSPNT